MSEYQRTPEQSRHARCWRRYSDTTNSLALTHALTYSRTRCVKDIFVIYEWVTDLWRGGPVPVNCSAKFPTDVSNKHSGRCWRRRSLIAINPKQERGLVFWERALAPTGPGRAVWAVSPRYRRTDNCLVGGGERGRKQRMWVNRSCSSCHETLIFS